MGKIYILPPEIAQKIAAGEVIERPASVIKELIENSLDAQASKIDIDLTQGGLNLIRVHDNGHGMDAHDLELCWQPHATSKIKGPEDLLAIETLGFRGEALASMAAVSRLVITSRPPESLLGHRIEIEYGHVKGLRETGAPKGTTVEVHHLFTNVPARRAFLKSIRTETLKATEIVRLMALAHPQVAFSLKASSRLVFHHEPSLGRQGLLASLAGVKEEDLREESLVKDTYQINLILSAPYIKFPTTRHFYLFVNQRPVRDRFLTTALLRALSGAFAKGQYPVVLLTLQTPPELVDVNVHPAKWEVRFREEKIIFNLIQQAVQRALSPRFYVSPTQDKSPPEEDLPLAPEPGPHKGPTGYGLDLDFLASARGQVKEAVPPYGIDSPPRAIGPLGQKYYLFEDQRGLVILDYHAAHERLIFERLKRAYQQKGLASQKLLLPVIKKLSAQALEAWETHQKLLSQLGFEIMGAGSTEIRILAVPALVGSLATEALEKILEEDLFSPPGQILDHVFASLACKAAIKAGAKMTPEEALDLFSQIKERGLTHCPHGRPLYWRITYDELEKRLGRRP